MNKWKRSSRTNFILKNLVLKLADSRHDYFMRREEKKWQGSTQHIQQWKITNNFLKATSENEKKGNLGKRMRKKGRREITNENLWQADFMLQTTTKKERIKVLKNDGKSINVEQINMKWTEEAEEKVYFVARQKSTLLTFFDSF